jgi:hypothetical protein
MVLICKKRIFNKLKDLKGLWFHIVGIACLIWFIIRVIPAPHRSQYPCQQISISIVLGYITFWSIIFYGFRLWLKRAKTKTFAIIPSVAVVFLLVFSMSGMVLGGDYLNENPNLDSWIPVSKDPMGKPIGINPGRVVWTWNPDATEKELMGFWWMEENNNQSIIDDMYSKGLKSLTDESTDYDAWDALFKDFNIKHDFGEIGYSNGEKIAIKINLNNVYGWDPFNTIDEYEHEDNDRDASPYVVISLLDHLVNVVGVNQNDITVYDTSRIIINWFYDRVSPLYPDVHYIDAEGGKEGREIAESSDFGIHFSDGLFRTLPKCVVDAKYMINMPLLKKHPIQNGITLSGKNLFGTFIEPVADLHPYHQSGLILNNPTPQTDLLAHEHIGGKTLLYIGDGTFGTLQDHCTICKFNMFPFNDDWTNSLFFSQDPIAIDSVMFDFLNFEGPSPIEGSQNYLHQSAEPMLNQYDPENDGEYVSESLGVHEHWDTSVSIFSSSRYSGFENQGIDLLTIGEEFITPSVIITQPADKKLYFRGVETPVKISWITFYSFPETIVIGNITVKVKVNNVPEVDYIKFFIDDELKYTDDEFPYEWEWGEISFSKHILKVLASIDGEENLFTERLVWKFF